jgi:hypothetical protein
MTDTMAKARAAKAAKKRQRDQEQQQTQQPQAMEVDDDVSNSDGDYDEPMRETRRQVHQPVRGTFESPPEQLSLSNMLGQYQSQDDMDRQLSYSNPIVVPYMIPNPTPPPPPPPASPDKSTQTTTQQKHELSFWERAKDGISHAFAFYDNQTPSLTTSAISGATKVVLAGALTYGATKLFGTASSSPTTTSGTHRYV